MARCSVVLATLALAACGGLESPDLATGTLRGRIVNGRAGGYVYVLGRPEAKVSIETDGRFVLAGLPAGDVTLAVIDGADPIDGTRRAALVPAEVEGADERELPALDAGALPLAGRVYAAARPVGGAVATASRFTLLGTDQIDVPGDAAGLSLLDPVPPGDFELAGSMAGYSAVRLAVTVVSGTSEIREVPFMTDLESPEPGCASTGACMNGLVCDVSDGECEECLADGDCAAHGAGARCVDHECTVAGTYAGTGLVCAGCSVDADCASDVCAFDGYSGFCTRVCSIDWNCPAGFACGQVGGRSVCVTPSGCEDLRERFGAPCFDDTACSEDLAGGTCEGEDRWASPPRPGYCTGVCTQSTPGACSVVSGYTCNAGMALEGVCVRP